MVDGYGLRTEFEPTWWDGPNNGKTAKLFMENGAVVAPSALGRRYLRNLSFLVTA